MLLLISNYSASGSELRIERIIKAASGGRTRTRQRLRGPSDVESLTRTRAATVTNACYLSADKTSERIGRQECSLGNLRARHLNP